MKKISSFSAVWSLGGEDANTFESTISQLSSSLAAIVVPFEDTLLYALFKLVNSVTVKLLSEGNWPMNHFGIVLMCS